MKVDYDGLVFNDEANGYLDPTTGVSWMCTAIDGWDSPNLRQTVQEPTSRHGTVLSAAHLGNRAMTLKGVFKAPTEQAFWNAWNRLSGQFNNVWADKVLTVTEDTTRFVQCRLAGNIRKEFVGVAACTFEVPLMADDPLKYGALVTTTIASGQTKVVANGGNFVTEAVKVTPQYSGHLAVANLTWGARGLSTDIEVPSGTVFDALKRSVTYGSRSIYGHLSAVSLWWGLQPGNNQVKNAGPGVVSLAYLPTWL